MTDWTDLLKNVTRIKLRGGVVGRFCTTVMVVAVAMAGIAMKLGVLWLGCLVSVLIFVLAFTLLWRLMNFADRNPQAALLEGAEFLAHERLQSGRKNKPIIELDEPRSSPEIARLKENVIIDE